MVDRTELDAIFERVVSSGEIPGVVALAADADGVIYSGAFGKRDRERGPAMTLDAVFRIASMTKLVTCVAALQLVEQGKLALDEPLGRVLPALASPQVLDGFAGDGTPQLRPARRPITLRHLLTHTAGCSYHMWNAVMARYRLGAGAGLSGKMAVLGLPLVFDPGERWEYGTNIDWAGELVAEVSGLSLEDYMREHIFGPLGMNDTSFVLGESRYARLASLHNRDAGGELRALPLEPPDPPSFFAGGGGLVATGPDYLTFLQALLHGGRLGDAQILRPDSVAALLTNQIGELSVGAFTSFAPGLSNDGEFFPGMVKRWSLGGMLTTADAPSGRRAGSLSWCGLFNSYFWLDPTRRITGVLLTQILPFLDASVLGLVDRFEQAVYQLRPA